MTSLLYDVIVFFCHPQPWVIDTLYLFLLSSTLITVGGVGEFRVKVMVVISPAFQGSRRGTRTQTCSWCLIQQYRHRIYPKSRSSLNTYRSTQRRLIKSKIYSLRTENQSWFTHSWYTHSSLKGGEKELVPSTGVSGLGFSLRGGWVVYHNVCIPKLCIPKCLYTKMFVCQNACTSFASTNEAFGPTVADNMAAVGTSNRARHDETSRVVQQVRSLLGKTGSLWRKIIQ